ncbi:MAG: peptidoglycan DD-metalloendopeptidase family protein [bacterium]
MNKKIVIIVIILISVCLLSYGMHFVNKMEDDNKVQAELIKTDRVVKIEIIEGSTFGKLMTEFSDLNALTVNGIYNASKDAHDLAEIRVGRFFELVYDKDTDLFKEFKYKIDSEDELIVFKNPEYKELEFIVVDPSEAEVEEIEQVPFWLAKVRPIPYEVRIKVSEGKVETSMYEAALKNDIDERAIIELANVFQWTIDFAMDPRVGDEFKFIYEERYLDNEYIMPGRILAGKYVNVDTVFDHYYFEESEDNKGYFDIDGNSVQKIFLKAPVEFKYISSGYTTGNRVIMEFGLSGPHMAIDYAASIGTPIRTVGDGSVIQAGWSNQGYGYLTAIRHNGTYTTHYAHQSEIAVQVGQRVEQGQTIGYVGNTGYSTGPHLHYEMIKNGVKIDPLKEVLPPGKPIKDENKERFFKEIKKYQKQLEV